MSDLSPAGLAEDVRLVLRLAGLPCRGAARAGGFEARPDGGTVRVRWQVNAQLKEAFTGDGGAGPGGDGHAPRGLERHIVLSMHRTIAEILLELGYTLMVLEPPPDDDAVPLVSVVDGPSAADGVRMPMVCQGPPAPGEEARR